MAKQTINPGTAPTGAGGDTFRSGSAKLQANDDEIYNQLGATAQGILPAALPISKGGTGATTAAAARTNLGLGTAATATLTTSSADKTSGRVLKVGDFGLGSSIPSQDYSTNSGMAGFSYTASAYPVGTPDGCMGNCVTLGHAEDRSSDIFLARGTNNGNLMPYPRLYFRAGVKDAWIQVLTSSNTTKDANGFIKGASPIVQLYIDKIELNNEAKIQDITFEKLGKGDYLIKGSSGFAQEGWYIETPKDANGNVLFSVVYETLENGDISVKTYKKKFNLETASIVADLDNPVDITENRWIDLRLQELSQPEIEEIESATPPDFQPTGLAESVATVMESYHDPEQ